MLCKFIERGALGVHVSTDSDLADASLVAPAESQGLHRILTLDGDFRVDRINGTTPFGVV